MEMSYLVLSYHMGGGGVGNLEFTYYKAFAGNFWKMLFCFENFFF